MTKFSKESIDYFLSKGATMEQIEKLESEMDKAGEQLRIATSKPRSADKLGIDYKDGAE